MQKDNVCSGYDEQKNDLNSSFVLVDREKMSGLSSMQVEGEVRNLGIVKNFKDNPELKKFLPEDLSISWAHLDPNEKLDTHRHPVASLIIAIEGAGSSQGDSELCFNAGDALFIPPWNEHGFTGVLPIGLWALSIQFNHIAIFENEIDPLTTFANDKNNLPSLSERQIIIFPRKETIFPSTFRSQKQLNQILPESVNFSWHKVDNQYEFESPKDNVKRLLIICSGKGSLLTPVNFKLEAGNAFWQNKKVIFNNNDIHPLWILSLEINQ